MNSTGTKMLLLVFESYIILIALAGAEDQRKNTLSNVRFQSRRNLYFPGKLIRQIHLKLNYIVNFLNS